MDPEVRLQNIKPSEALRHHIERRFHRALRRFEGRVRSLRLRFVDVNGPKGGVDKDCIIDADLAPRGNVVVRERGPEFYAAVDRAAGRFRRLLGRALRRARDRRRGRESIRTHDFRERGKRCSAEF